MKTNCLAVAMLAGLIAMTGYDRASTPAASTAPAPAPVATPTAAPVPAPADYVAGEEAWRREQDAALRDPKDSWLTVVGLHWVTPQTRTVGSAEGQDLRLALGPARLGIVNLDGKQLHFTPAPAVDVTVDGKPVPGRIALQDDKSGAPTRLSYDGGKGTLWVIERSGRYGLRERHQDAPALKAVVPQVYWPIDPSWRVEATLEPHPPGTTIEIVNVLGDRNQVPNPGALVFVRDGKTFRMEVTGEKLSELSGVFADRTNGRESYGAGRFIDPQGPDAQGRYVLDFNRAYNPPCAFTAFATCPLPPPSNRLDLAVTAGEKKYPGGAH
jgi:hypothetical protein